MRCSGDAGGVRDAFLADDPSIVCIEHDETSAIRRCQADKAFAAVDGDGADIVGKADRGVLRQRQEGQALAPAEMPDERRQVVARAFILAGKPDAALGVQVDMAGGKLAQRFGQRVTRR